MDKEYIFNKKNKILDYFGQLAYFKKGKTMAVASLHPSYINTQREIRVTI